MYDKKSLNRVMLIGRLGQDPDVNFTKSNTKVANLSLATSASNKEGEERTEWHKVTVFGKTAEIVEKYAGKGSQIFVEGRLQTDKWEDKEGETRYMTKVYANNVQLLGDGGNKGQNGGKQPEPETNEPEQDEDDDLPF